MTDAGFDWFDLPAAGDAAREPIGFGVVLSMEEAKASGYPSMVIRDEQPDAMGTRLAETPGASDRASECSDALRAIPALLSLADGRAQFIDDPPMASIAASVEYANAMDGWAGCMTAAGHSGLPDPDSARFRASELDADGSRTLAVADAICQAKHEVYPRLNRALRAATLRWLEEHPAALDDLDAAYRSAVEWATALGS